MNALQSRFMLVLLYVIIGLVCLITFALLLAIFGIFGQTESAKDFVKWGQYAVLGELIVLFIYVVRKIFSSLNKKIEIYLTLPPELDSIDFTEIIWDNDQCFITLYDLNNRSKTIKDTVLVKNNESGTGWQIDCPDHVNDKLFETDNVEISLKDKKGLEWHVRAFRPLRRSISVEFLGDKNQLAAYVNNNIER